ncbi:hypothetical protein A1O1_01745 [Capronia coronata CBS 617.96]|uniref:Major facilitator superfamily (MFS) profile domain-containing protein n=1 Tax=Capronia coronata CBS 617.96 TaxID=1182541 RepID=W9YLE7_9EURO|nr:uncharacterized protein A1O1_01745 [Capronia coronata CBS 617.96]EXJ93353.1 hypothetical protein A1O1_01745 [Capronia coronata CBS 617.96]
MASQERAAGHAVEARPFIPGTVHLVDLEGTMRAKHASKGHKDIVLVPAPSNDPDDPLNWTPARKLLSTSCMCVYVLMVGIASAAIYSVLVPISDATGMTLGDLNAGTGYMFLFFGWGCLVWQPLALQYGKRPVYLLSLIATICTQVWAGYTTTNGNWIANKILQGFFGAPVESLCEISVTDIYFTHERGFYIAIYGLFLAGSNFFAPIIAGFISDAMGWKWVVFWAAIFNGIGFIYCFLFMEETNYSRKTITGQESAEASGTQTPITSGPEKGANPDEKTVFEPPPSTEEGLGVVEWRKKTYLQKLKLFQPGVFSKKNELAGMMIRPLKYMFTFPVVAYAGFSYGSSLVWFNMLNGTASLILSGAPYNFAASMVGVSYVSPLLGVFAAAAYTGIFGDWFILRLARKRRGMLEPEYRLWLFVASLVAIPLGLILWGAGAAHHVHWFGLIFAMGVIAYTNTVGLQLSISYCVDSYRDLAGETIITVIIIRNTMSFAIGYGLTPWVDNMGYQNAFIVAAFAGLAQALMFVIFIKFGKLLRQKSTNTYLKYVEEITAAGLTH